MTGMDGKEGCDTINKHIVISGIKGVGKTNLLDKLPELYQGKYNILYHKYYNTRYNCLSFSHLIYSLSKRLNEIIEINNNCGYIFQKSSIYEDYIIAQLLKDEGLISGSDLKTYTDLYNSILKLIKYPDLFIYLDKDLPGMSNSILVKTRHYYEEMMLRLSDYTNVLLVDWNKPDIETLCSNIYDIINENEINISKGMIEAKKMFREILDKQKNFLNDNSYKLLNNLQKDLKNE